MLLIFRGYIGNYKNTFSIIWMELLWKLLANFLMISFTKALSEPLIVANLLDFTDYTFSLCVIPLICINLWFRHYLLIFFYYILFFVFHCIFLCLLITYVFAQLLTFYLSSSCPWYTNSIPNY